MDVLTYEGINETYDSKDYDDDEVLKVDVVCLKKVFNKIRSIWYVNVTVDYGFHINNPLVDKLLTFIIHNGPVNVAYFVENNVYIDLVSIIRTIGNNFIYLRRIQNGISQDDSIVSYNIHVTSVDYGFNETNVLGMNFSVYTPVYEVDIIMAIRNNTSCDGMGMVGMQDAFPGKDNFPNQDVGVPAPCKIPFGQRFTIHTNTYIR